jgi:PPM family protein phosphatase
MEHLREYIRPYSGRLQQGSIASSLSLWLWPGWSLPQQDYSLSLIYGFIIGLLILFLVIVPLLLWRKRRHTLKTIELEREKTAATPEVTPVEITAPVMAAGEPNTLPASGQRPAGIGWQFAGLSDVGLKRELNEDSLLMLEADIPGNVPCGLYAVADGMGGHEKGEVASQLTLDIVRQQFSQQPPSDPYGDWLKAAAITANEAVLARQEPNAPERKMGSTLVMALVVGRQAYIANVGDSRAYCLHSEGITQISEDHSLVERLVQIGQITREEARVHRQRNVIYNTIGDKSNLQVSLYETTLHPGDRLLLCSDGLNTMLTDEEILALGRQHATPAAACKAMVQAAKLAGGADNITAIIVHME